PAAGEPGVGVVRVLPRGEAEFGAGGDGDASAHPQQRAVPRRVVWAHPGDRPGSGAAADSEQHRLGLIVEGVSEQHRGFSAGGGQRLVAGRAGGRLRTAGGADLDPQNPGGDAAQLQRLSPGGLRDLGRTGLQLVVDDQRGGGLELGRHRGQGQRVRTAGQRHTPAVVGAGPGAFERGQRRPQGGYSTRSIHRCGSSISAGSGRVSGLSQDRLNRSMPTFATTWSTNALPRVYWLILASTPSRARTSRCSGGCLRCRRSSNRRRITETVGTTAGPTASITCSACPSSRVPSTSSWSSA